MKVKNSVSGARRRAVAVSTALAMGMFFGVTSVAAHATCVTVRGTVGPCEISITSSESADLGAPSYDYDAGNFVFSHDEAISFSWHADGVECAGALYASRTEIVLEAATAVTGSTSLIITSFGVDGEGESPVDAEAEVGVTAATPVEIKTPSASGGDETFGVKMLIPLTSPAGVYSSIVTFTVVVE
jgi:hypothetical protein